MSVRNDVELAERVAHQNGAPASDLAYWHAVATRFDWPAQGGREVEAPEAEDWRDR